MKGVRLWVELLHYLFAGVVILTEYFQASITAAITYRLKVQSLQETGGVCLSVSMSYKASSPSLDSCKATDS